MAVTGYKKAAMLLKTLDHNTATELLKGQPKEVIQKIAMELSQMEARSKEEDSEELVNAARDFCSELIQQNQGGAMHVRSFVRDMLKDAAGQEKASELQAQLNQKVLENDPFIAISSANPAQISAALENEPPQAIALVLSSIPTHLTTEILNRLDEEKAQKTIWRMTQSGEVSPRTIRRIGEIIYKRLLDQNSENGTPVEAAASKETLRRLALVLSGMQKDRRDSMLAQIENKDEATANMVKALMVTWEDILKIENKSLQQAIRNVEATVLAKALHGADPKIADKIRSNISERAAQMVDEEAALLGEPRKKDILEAREQVAQPLREANEAEELLFIEE